jgi:hypothetical protein
MQRTTATTAHFRNSHITWNSSLLSLGKLKSYHILKQKNRLQELLSLSLLETGEACRKGNAILMVSLNRCTRAWCQWMKSVHVINISVEFLACSEFARWIELFYILIFWYKELLYLINLSDETYISNEFTGWNLPEETYTVLYCTVLYCTVLYCSGAHPASYQRGTRVSFPGGTAAGAWS